MNEVMERQSSALAAPDKNYFEQYADAVNANRIVGDLLRFNKGDWLAGQDQDEMEEGTRLVANVPELLVGWVKWVDSKPEEQIMGRVADGFKPPKRSELGDQDEEEWGTDDQGRPRDPWQLTNYLILKDEDGDQLYTLAGSSKGMLGAIGKVSGEYGKRYRQKPDEIPIIELGTDKYKHKVHSWVKVPVLKVVGWVYRGAFDEALAADAEANRSDEGDEGDADLPFDDPPATPAKKSGGKARGSAAAEKTAF